jgi:hypothetical protein
MTFCRRLPVLFFLLLIDSEDKPIHFYECTDSSVLGREFLSSRRLSLTVLGPSDLLVKLLLTTLLIPIIKLLAHLFLQFYYY